MKAFWNMRILSMRLLLGLYVLLCLFVTLSQGFLYDNYQSYKPGVKRPSQSMGDEESDLYKILTDKALLFDDQAHRFERQRPPSRDLEDVEEELDLEARQRPPSRRFHVPITSGRSWRFPPYYKGDNDFRREAEFYPDLNDLIRRHPIYSKGRKHDRSRNED